MSATMQRIYEAYFADQRTIYPEETKKQILVKFRELSLESWRFLDELSDEDLFHVCCGEQIDEGTKVRLANDTILSVPKEVSDFLNLVFEWSTD
jgi:hypothetical protein